MQDKIIETLCTGDFKGVSFTFTEKKGMELTFSVSGVNAENADAAAIAKSAIKATDYGKGLFVSVTGG